MSPHPFANNTGSNASNTASSAALHASPATFSASASPAAFAVGRNRGNRARYVFATSTSRPASPKLRASLSTTFRDSGFPSRMGSPAYMLPPTAGHGAHVAGRLFVDCETADALLTQSTPSRGLLTPRQDALFPCMPPACGNKFATSANFAATSASLVASLHCPAVGKEHANTVGDTPSRPSTAGSVQSQQAATGLFADLSRMVDVATFGAQDVNIDAICGVDLPDPSASSAASPKQPLHTGRAGQSRAVPSTCPFIETPRDASAAMSTSAIIDLIAAPTWQLRVLQPIGRGSFGSAWLVEVLQAPSWYVVDEPSKLRLVAKVIDPDRRRQRSSITISTSTAPGGESLETRESAIMRTIHHPNLLGCVDSGVEAGDMQAILMPYCDGGDLATLIAEARSQRIMQMPWAANALLPESRIWSVLVQLIAGLQYLATAANVVHRDVKPRNVFLHSTGRVVLGDYGVACHLGLAGAPHTPTGFCGSPNYAAPELFERKQFDGRADVWSTGCVLYELLTHGDRAFGGEHARDVAHAVCSRRCAPLATHPVAQRYSPELLALVESMLTVDVAARPTSAEVLANPMVLGRLPELFATWLSCVAASPEYAALREAAKAVVGASSCDAVAEPALCESAKPFRILTKEEASPMTNY